MLYILLYALANALRSSLECIAIELSITMMTVDVGKSMYDSLPITVPGQLEFECTAGAKCMICRVERPDMEMCVFQE